MNKLTICLFSFLLLSISTYGQPQSRKRDFNKDGVIDQVTIVEDGGPAFSSKEIQYFDGKTKKEYDFSMFYSFGSFFGICNIPDVIGSSGSESIGEILFSRKDTIDASLNWLIEACSNKVGLKGSQLVDFSTKYTPAWIPGEPKIPQGYYAILSNYKYEKLLKNTEGSPGFDFNKMKSASFWIDYNPHNHKGFRITKGEGENRIYTTSHGVVIKNNKGYSWVFVNDNRLFDANDKLRWPSIDEVQMIREFLLVKQSINTGDVNLFIIDPVSGFVIRLNKDFIGLGPIAKVIVNEEKERVELSDSSGKNYSFTLKVIMETFHKVFSL
ncbi:hypothetical protein [Chitinophaga niabensis]|uniref:Uncharacterized protein n=1 Tax=Chitinophaga niabensis TaxID=536979 RepID=A0A1N6ER31_9BACT|nr:hypothetical protein [Chitinophaga niabensis]SIN85475.1 hypothetical protein SAMN04488055_1773 [Chitinophaga niabensis]